MKTLYALLFAALIAAVSAQSSSSNALFGCSTMLLNSTNGFDIVLLGSPLPSASASPSPSVSPSALSTVLDASNSLLGRTAANGNAYLMNSIVGNSLSCPAASSSLSLFLSGVLNSTNSEVVCGTSMAQGGIIGTLYNATTATGSSSNSSLINFSMASSNLLQASSALCSLPASGSVSLNNGIVVLDATSLNSSSSSSSSSNYAIFDLPNSDLINITSIIINGTISSEYIIINVINNSSAVTISGASSSGTSSTSSSTLDLDNLDTNIANGLSATNLLWNFCNASTIDIYNILLMGSILAPNASLNATRANIDGSIIAGSLTASFLNQVPMPYTGSFCFNSTSSSM